MIAQPLPNMKNDPLRIIMRSQDKGIIASEGGNKERVVAMRNGINRDQKAAI